MVTPSERSVLDKYSKDPTQREAFLSGVAWDFIQDLGKTHKKDGLTLSGITNVFSLKNALAIFDLTSGQELGNGFTLEIDGDHFHLHYENPFSRWYSESLDLNGEKAEGPEGPRLKNYSFTYKEESGGVAKDFQFGINIGDSSYTVTARSENGYEDLIPPGKISQEFANDTGKSIDTGSDQPPLWAQE